MTQIKNLIQVGWNMKQNKFGTLIIGAGPAGLSIANALVRSGDTDFFLIDSGRSLAERDRHSPGGISSGMGGAGLFSDGKFSFYPSASKLWLLPNKESLNNSYQWLIKLFARYNMVIPAIDLDNVHYIAQESGSLKYYPSFYLTLEERYHLIKFLSNALHNRAQFNTLLTDIIQMSDGTYQVITDRGMFYCDTICWAAGKMSTLLMQQFSLKLPHQFQRMEIGIRIQGHHKHPFFRELVAEQNVLDPKYIFRDGSNSISWRTFCFCRRGEIVNSGTEEQVWFSGRSDCEPTELSNIGFNTRIEQENIIDEINLPAPFTLSLKEFFSNPDVLAKHFSKKYAVYIAKGIHVLANRFPTIQQESHNIELVGPTIEGVGYYPIVDGTLKVENHSIYVAGDAVGSFRGITAAMLSGYYIGEQITNRKNIMDGDDEYLQFARNLL